MTICICLTLFAGTAKLAYAQYNYTEALQKTFFFYEAQESGPKTDHNRVEWRGSSHLNDGQDMDKDLTGGWYDAGDTPKWNTSMAFLGTTLAWAGAEYKEGFVDSGQMPYLLNSLKFVCDYFSKCFIYTDINDMDTYKIVIDIGYPNAINNDNDGSTQDGNPSDPDNPGKAEHGYWAPHEVFEQIFPQRPTYYADKEYSQSGIVAAMAATLASSAYVLRDNGYTATPDAYLEKARKLYNFAKTYRNTSEYYKNANGNKARITGYGNSDDADELAWAALWLHRAEKQRDASFGNTYLEAAVNYAHDYRFQVWNDKYMYGSAKLASYVLLARLHPSAPTSGDKAFSSANWFKEQVEQNLSGAANGDGGPSSGFSPGGLAKISSEWGTLRHVNNQAFVALVYADKSLTNGDLKTSYVNFAKSQLDYTLGSNPKNRSYLIGFQPSGKSVVGTTTTEVDVHHGTAHGTWKGKEHSMSDRPEFQNLRHTLYGAIVGGPDWSDNFWKLDGNKPDGSTYEAQTEVAIDYNGGLTGSLARMVEKGEGSGSALSDFPPAESRSGAEDEEYFVEADINASGTNYVEIKAYLNNRSRWPAKVRTKMSFRYYYTADGGATVTPTIVFSTDDDATISSPVNVSGDQYYVTVSFNDVAIYPGYEWNAFTGYYKEVVFKLTNSDNITWNNDNDWSYSGFDDLGAFPPNIAGKIPVYDDGTKLNGDEPSDNIADTEPVSNIALNQDATASGECSTNEGAGKAVNGSISNGNSDKWCQDGSGDKWLKLDLGQNYNINRWVVKHAASGGELASWNTSNFKLQKSTNGTSGWTDVDQVTNNTANTTDRNVTSFSARYVRLYITNAGADGVARIYELELYGSSAGRRNSEFGNGIAEENMSVFPNPAKSTLTVNYRAAARGEVQVTIKDVLSRSVQTISRTLEAGNNQIPVDVRAMENGVYLVQVRERGVSTVKRVVVSRQ